MNGDGPGWPGALPTPLRDREAIARLTLSDVLITIATPPRCDSQPHYLTGYRPWTLGGGQENLDPPHPELLAATTTALGLCDMFNRCFYGPLDRCLLR